MAEEIAKFRFNRYHILKSSIEITDISNIGKEFEVEITRSGGVNNEDNKYKLLLEVAVKGDSLNIHIAAEAFFDFDKDLDEDKKAVFFNVNAPAILFPYLRAYVSALTALSGVSPITLPTINLAGKA